ncbi:MAG: DUF6507 family protein [Dermatophilaceae bacterium]
MSTTPVEGDAYRVMPVEARRVVTVTEDQGLELGRTADDLAREVDAASAAVGAGSPVTDALAELRTLHVDLAAGWATSVDRAVRGAREAIDAYVAADLEMERRFDDFVHGRGIQPPPDSFVGPPMRPAEPFVGPVAPR